jgi:hypothetical protein
MAFSHGIIDPASRFRVLQFFPYFEQAGWQVKHRPKRPGKEASPHGFGKLMHWISSPLLKSMRRRNRQRDIHESSQCDVIFQNRDLLQGDLHWEQLLVRKNPRWVFDFDDAIFLGAKKRRHMEWVCRHAAWVTAGNQHLAEFAERLNPNVSVLPTTVETEKYQLKNQQPDPMSPLRIGWMGSDYSIRQTLFPYLEMLAEIQREAGFEFFIVSNPKPKLPPTRLKWNFLQWSPDLEIRISDFLDVGIMPLVDNAFQHGKCGLKLLQYMAAGLPVIASPVGVNVKIVGDRGLLAASAADWREAILLFCRDRELIAHLGMRGRAFCMAEYDIKIAAATLLGIFEHLHKNEGSGL